MSTTHMSNTTRQVEVIIAYTFTDPLILWEALQAAGSTVRSAGTRRFPDGNKRLAVLGDTVLKLVLVGEWYDSPDARGRASDILQQVGSNANLDRVGRARGLDAHVCRNPSQGSYIAPVTMAATIEAILGAVYLDSNINKVGEVMQTLGLVST